MFDQSTACHTTTVMTETENAESVRRAYEESVRFISRKPEALVHDNKPIHKDRKLRDTIDPDTAMIPATPRQTDNKAVIEGEFGKFQQAVGSITLDKRLSGLTRQASTMRDGTNMKASAACRFSGRRARTPKKTRRSLKT